MTPRIAIIGHVCVDENTIDGERTVRWGSPLLYMAEYFIKKHDIRPVLIAPYSKDLAEYVNTGLLLNKPSGFNTLRYRNRIRGDARIQSCVNTLNSGPVKLIPEMKKTLKSTDIFIFAPLLPNYKAAYLKAIEKILPSECLKIILPQGYLRKARLGRPIIKREFKEYANILSQFTTSIQSDEDSEYSERTAKRWSEQFPDLHVIVTRNRKGSIDFTKGHGTEVPTVSASDQEMKNPIGAGDIFGASYSYYYGQSGDKNASIVKARHDTYESLAREA